MKNVIRYTGIVAVLFLSSCENWLKEPAPNQVNVSDYFISETTAVNNVNADYTPLMWEWNNTFFGEVVIGDIMSDDALKGGNGVTDCRDLYYMENFKADGDNEVLLQYYRAQYLGIARCNVSIKNISAMDKSKFVTNGIQDRILGEARFLRAMYYFRLVRMFGSVPLVLEPITQTSDWKQKRAEVGVIYDSICADLELAEKLLWEKDDSRFVPASDLGRATKGAAQAMLLKVYLYRKNYQEAVKWGDKIVSSKKYSLIDDYAANFTLEEENNEESVFDIQYMSDGQSDWGEGFGYTRGTFMQVWTRSRASNYWNEPGYGFDKPTQNLYDEYEDGDSRREATFWIPVIEPSMQEVYLGNMYCSRKYALIQEEGDSINKEGQKVYYGKYVVMGHETRGPLNTKYIRYADVLLLYAEACHFAGNDAKAEECLEEVRKRARALAKDPATQLPKFPDYKIKINGIGEPQTPTLMQAIQHERRIELAMEGHRWFDLCRWGIAPQVMEAYKQVETPAARAEMATCTNANLIFPIPSKEVDLNNMY